MELVDEISGLLEPAYLRYQQERAVTSDEFTQCLSEWLKDILARLSLVNWQREWQLFADEWQVRGVDVEDASQLFAFLNEQEAKTQRATVQSPFVAIESDGAEKPASSLAATTEEERKSFDSFFEDATRRQHEEKQEDEKLRKEAAAKAAPKIRQHILDILGKDLKNIPEGAVARLRKEGLILRETHSADLNDLQLRAVIELPREDGGTDTLVLRKMGGLFEKFRWQQESLQIDTGGAAVVKNIEEYEKQRHAAVMRIGGATIQAQMAAYEILSSGGTWPLILQGLDQLQTAGRNLANEGQHNSAIVALATKFYQEQMGLSPEQAKKAAERFEELLPILAGITEVGLGKIKETTANRAANRGKLPDLDSWFEDIDNRQSDNNNIDVSKREDVATKTSVADNPKNRQLRLFEDDASLSANTNRSSGKRASSDSAPELPTFKEGGKTTGVLQTPAGDFSLVSGRTGPAASLPKPTPGFNAITVTHVEGHAAAIMRQDGIQEATLYINNPQVCVPCEQNLANMLPSDSTLTVVLPDGTSKKFTGNSR